MDKAISQEVISARRNRTIFISILAVVALSSVIWFVRSSIKSSLDSSEISTAVVEVGSIENTINATGEIIPEFEQVITSPIAASIKDVMMEAGTPVKAGQSILALDKQATETEYNKLKFQLESKRNNIEKLKLELNKSFYDIQSNNDIKQLRINSLQASVEDAKRLYKAGGGTKESIEQAELALKVALLEKKQLENEIKNKQQTMKVDIRESEIAAAIQQNDLKELERKLQQANITATRDGVITWVNKNIGSSINQGESLVRIADLASFKVTGSISDTYLDKVHTGMQAIIRINDSTIRGTVSNINPSIQNGIVSFDITLNERNNKLLRPNMKVDVFLVTSTENNVLRVANGPAFKGSTTQDIFVISNGKAVRRTVNIGMTNFDYVQLKGNVKPGDIIIISDMSEYKNSKEINIHNFKTNETKTSAYNFSPNDVLLTSLHSI
jgi:HlyD family secretion protein